MASRIQKNRNRLKRSAVMLMLTVILCLSQIPAAVFAADDNGSSEVTAAQKGSLTYLTPEKGLTVHIYKVGTVDEKGKTQLASEYQQKYQLTQDDKTMAVTLAAYLERDKVAPLDTKISGEDHAVKFENLERGWYLLTGDTASVNGTIYTQTPGFVTMPLDDPSGKTWNPTVQGKYGQVKYTELKVQKVWQDSNSTSRPTSITVQLLRDGEIYQEVTLDAKNSWSFAWKDLDFTKKWTIVEKSVTSGYTVKMEQNAGLITITNTKPGDVKPDNDTKIPQTGQLWWPVPILALAGLLCLIIGLRRRSRD